MTDEVRGQLETLPVEELRTVRGKLEEVAEMSEGFPPVNPLWTRRLKVSMVKMRVNIGRHELEFEIDTPNETLRVTALASVSS